MLGRMKCFLQSCSLRLLVLLALYGFLSSTLYAKGDDGKTGKKHAEYYLPQPDVLPPLPVEDRVIKNIDEPNLYPVFPKAFASSRCGIDVSRYQSEIDWQEVRKDPNVTFVYLKATESTGLVDRTYYANLNGARAVGLPVGVYHFFSPKAPAHQQLLNFMRAVDPKTQDLIPIVDVEVAPRRKSQVGAFLKSLRSFVDGVERYFGCKPMIYTSQYFYNTYLAGKFLDCPFMLAKYSGEVPEVVDEIRFLVWQFTASGSVRGIEGNVDRSCLMNHYTVDDLRYSKAKQHTSK